MNYPFEIQRVPAFLGTKNITHLFQDQYNHIVEPVMEVAEKALDGQVDPRMSGMLCPPGSGKTTVFNIDLIWRVAALAVKKNSTNNLITTEKSTPTTNSPPTAKQHNPNKNNFISRDGRG